MQNRSLSLPKTLIVVVGSLLLISLVSWGALAPDASGVGPLAVTSSEYKLPASIDPVVLADAPVDFRLMTELWARVYRPVNLAGAPFPLLVFLHGNHATCGRIAGAGQGHFDINVQYTFNGTCPPGYIVVRSDEGYAYLAERLASWGYIVVSINANRGVNAAPGYLTGASVADPGLNLRRGRLVLRHLEQLYRWNTGVDVTPLSLGFNLASKLDFSNVGLMGHSRGGEGVRAAYNYYLNPALPARGQDWQTAIPGLSIKAIFEIGPVDGQTGILLNAPGTVWNVLLPMCDGDVFNLQGVRPFDRMLLDFAELPVVQKSTFTVWGTNHNFYNTEWQTSDSPGCFANERLFQHLYGSADQRAVALASVLALFRGNVGPAADPAFNRIFNPQVDLPLTVSDITRVDRGFSDTRDAFDDFPVTLTNTYASSGVTFGFDRVPNHSSVQRAAHVEWNSAGPSTFFQSNWTAPGSGKNVSAFKTLDFRLSRQCGNQTCSKPDELFNLETNFSIRLVGKDGELSSPVQLKNYSSLTGPVGGLVLGFGAGIGATPHPILQTARVPLADFANTSILQNLRGVRFTFDDTRRDEIYIANIRFSANSDPGGLAPVLNVLPTTETPLNTAATTRDTNSVSGMRSVTLASGQSAVDIELTSNREFLPQGEMLVLKIGDREFTNSRYPASGETTTVTFTLTAAEFGQVSQGETIVVQYGSGEGAALWQFGRIDRNTSK